VNYIKRKINNYGFAHLELIVIVAVIAGIASVGFYIYKHQTTSYAAGGYSSLKAIDFGGQVFYPKACLDPKPVATGRYKVDALMVVNRQAGKNTSPSYNPVVVSNVFAPDRNGATGASQSKYSSDNWTTADTSVLGLYPVGDYYGTFSLGIKGYLNGKLTEIYTPRYTIGSLDRCYNGANYDANSITHPYIPPAPPITSSSIARDALQYNTISYSQNWHSSGSIFHQNCSIISPQCATDCSGLVDIVIYDVFGNDISENTYGMVGDKTNFEVIPFSRVKPGDFVEPNADHISIIESVNGNTINGFAAQTDGFAQPDQVGYESNTNPYVYVYLRYIGPGATYPR